MGRRFSLIAMLAAALVAGAAAIALAATPPVVSTQPAKDVGQTQATLVAQVDPKGSSTTVQFELGTSTSYGLMSASKDAGSGTGTVTVEIPVQGLTPSTTYHARAVATSDGGTVRGADVTFTTQTPPPVPTKPSATTGGVRDVLPASATLTGTVNPHAAATTYHFEWGLTTGYGQLTPDVSAGSGTKSLAATAKISGLQSGKRYHYRVVATNAQGTTKGGDRSFVAATTPTSATLAADRDPVVYAHPVTLTGRLAGTKVSGVRVRLQTKPFPFSSPFADLGAPVKSSRTGTYAFTIPLVTTTLQAVVVADGLPAVTSRAITIHCAVRAGITRVRRTRAHLIVSGRLTPVTPNGTAALQRQAANGRWVPLRHAGIAADGRYSITLKPRRRTMIVRVVGLARDGGAHTPGASRVVRIRGVKRPA